MKILRIIPVLTIMALYCGNAIAGLVVTAQSIRNDGSEVAEKIFIDQDKIKIEWPDFTATFDLKAQTLVLADPAALTFYLGTLSEYTTGVKEFKLDLLKKSIIGMPEDQAAESLKIFSNQIEHYFDIPDNPAGSIQIIKHGFDGKVSGYKTDKYEISLNGSVKEEIWISPVLKAGDGINWSNFLKFLITTGIMDKDLAYMSSPEYIGLLKTGFPLRIIRVSDGTQAEFQVSDLEEKPIPGYEFSTPALSKKLNIAGWLGQKIDKENDYDDYE